jgi:Kef-type K+ transport system membrane component KefB
MIFLQLLVLLLLARVCGEGAVRLGQPAVMGEILAGVLLAAVALLPGPHVPFTAALINGEVFHHAATAGIFFLMLLAGIELKPREMSEKSLTSLSVALGGAMVPLGAGIALGYLFLPPGDSRFALALLIGVAMSITAIPASVRILSDLGMLHTPAGRVIIAAALYDDVIGLVLLAVLTALLKTGAVPDAATLALLFGKIAFFFAVTISLGVHVYPRVSRGLGAFLLVWAVMKFVVPAGTVGIFTKFYGLSIDVQISVILGAAQAALALAIIVGLWRKWTLAAGFAVHAVGQLASWRETLDPWGIWLISNPKMLFWAGVPVMAAFAVAWLARDLDTWCLDARCGDTKS